MMPVRWRLVVRELDARPAGRADPRSLSPRTSSLAAALPRRSLQHPGSRPSALSNRDETYFAGISRASWPRPLSLRLRWCAPTQASMPIRHGGRLENRASTWPRDHFWRSTMAPRSSWPTMERVLADIDADDGDGSLGGLGHGVLLVVGAPCQL